MAWSTALVVLLAIVAAFYLFGGSIVLWLSSLVLKNWRYTSRGFEWDKDTDAVIPTLLIRRFSFHWGGRKAWSKGGSGLLVLKASGISFRRGMEHDGHERTDEPAVKSPSSLVTLIKTSILPPILNLLLHHSSWLPSLFQVQLCDIRIINDDLGGLEGTVEDITLSLQVDFKGFEAAETPCPTGIASPRTIYHRGHPLEMSPPTSPTIFTNFAHPFSGLASPPSPSTPLAEHPEQRSRFDQARRRATSGFNSSIRGIASSASHYWTRAIGRAHGSVTCTVDIVGVAVILPDSSSPITGRSRSASEDETSMLQKRPRALSLRSMPSMPSIFRRSASPYLPSDERGYEKLASLRGRSMAKVSMAFGPHIGLLGESSFNTSIELAELKSNLASMEKIRDILARRKKARGDASKSMPGEKDVEKKLHKNFASAALPRILLRAFDSVSLAIRCVNLSHFIPSTHHAPPDSGSSDATLTPDTDQPGFTVALDVEDVRLAFNAADATNSEFAKAAFGNSTKCESRVRGIGYELEWQNVSLHCVSPGEIATDRIELVAVRQASFRGISTWRPVGWSREELLFANDPNLSLLVLQSDIASLDGAADVQMLSELRSAWRASRPVCKPKETADTTPRPPLSAILGLPPRLEATLEIGNIMFVLGDRVAGQRTALSIASEGLNIGISTTFEDIIGRRRDGTGHRRAFNEEEALYGRRNATTEYDAALPPAMQRPAFRRTYRVEQAVLQDDLAIRMLIDSQATIKPVAIHLTLGDQEPVSHKLASIGQIHAAFDGAVSGVVDVRPDGSDLPRLMMSTLSSSLDLGVDAGVQLSLADGAVIDALQAMGVQHRQHSVPTPPSEPSATFLDQMPAGVSSRISIGTLSVFVGHPDVYPNGKLDLVRGVFLQTAITFEYAYYTHRSQCIRHRLHVPKTAQRKSLRLDEDIATQAVACFNEYSDKGGRAVLATATCSDVLVRPIYSATGFAKAGGVGRKHRRSRQTAKTRAPGFQAFDFRHFASNDEVSEGDFANMDEEDEVDPAFQARRPLVQVPQLRTDLSIVRPNSEAATEIKILPKLDRLAVVGDMSHVYCCLLANLAIQKLAKAWRRPTAEPVHARSVMAKPRVEIWIPVATLDITFPLHERLFFHIKGLSVSMLPGEGTLSTVEQAVVYVPSPADKGQFEEYLGIQSIRVVTPPPDKPPAIDVSCDSLRLHIPYSYVTAKPVLNINVTIKAMKTLLKNMRTGSFSTSHEPAAEQPKIVPPISFSAKAIRIEFADNALEQDLNLIFRAGQVEQQRRNDLEDVFERKVNLVSGEGESSSEDSVAGKTKLTRNSTVSLEQAREGLDKAMAVQWKERIAAAQRERRRRVEAAGKRYRSSEVRGNLPVKIRARPAAHPLFSVTWSSAKIQVTSLGKKREEVVQLMSDLSAPFAPDSKFSLMVPLHIRWTMEQAEVKLRDYPLPLISVPASGTDEPSWLLETPFIIAEELHGPDTWFAVPTEIVPENLGAYGAKPLFIQVQKTITPVKTYARPHLQINAATKTDFTWGNSYQPAIQDLMRVIDTISHPPKDPSDKPGFWDKFRLTLHWQVQMDFKGPLHLHLKGSYDPYNVTGHGTGFAVVWKSGTQVRIAQPNPEYETIQITSDELLVVIPDLTSLSDSRATGTGKGAEPHVPTHRSGMESEEELIRRRYTKPCARFLGGVRVGFGFRFERTCREWSCRHNCGATENLARRRCRIFDFKKHQDVIMRNPQAVEQAEQELGHASDSLEGFRSDFIHFSISTVLNKPDQARLDSSSMHFTPKATAHFLAWWRLFNSTMSLPIRHGKLFPNSPPPSKKFGRNIATIKYRFDLHDMYLSHMYTQIVPELWKAGKTRSLGVKGKIGRWRMDLHQRRQERIVKNEKLGRTNVVAHKPFYAINLMLDDIQARLIQADFLDIAMRRPEDPATAEEEQKMVHADKLPESQRIWYNFFDYIDADRKPFDQNPKILVTELADCPHIFWSKRVKAVQISRDDEDESSLFKVGRPDIESTKFGREESHICYMDQVPGIAETQTDIARKRVRELQHDWSRCGSKDGETATDREAEERNLKERLRNLHQHMHRLASEEHREIDNETLVDARDLADNHVSRQSDAEHSFENEVHIHNAKLFLNNTSRNMAYRYYYSNQDRKREEYTSSYASLRSLRDERYRRLREEHMRPPLTPNEKARDDVDDAAGALVQELANLLKSKPGENMFRMPSSIDTEDKCLRLAKQGLPRDARAKAKNRILLLNPQIALRSELDDKSIVLLAVNEVSFRGYQVVDEQGADAVSADIMSRNFISMKGLEGFYPSAKTMQRHHENKGFPRTLDFLPLEILLDTKSEATEYDRIVQRTDAALAVDKFNHLRMPRGIEWPQVLNDFGEPIKHLTLHQDLTTVVIPRLTVSATSTHYTALYNIVTDLLLYKDPRHRARSDRIDGFMYTFDNKDRNIARLIMDLWHLQRTIQHLHELAQGYEANADLITDEGKRELFNIRTDLLDATEQLFTVFEAVSINAKRDDARAELITSHRLNAAAGGIAWHMLRDNLQPLEKLDIAGTLFSHVTNTDGSTDSGLAINELAALNSNPDAEFHETLVRYEPMGRKAKRDPFASAAWSISTPVGGIDIWKSFTFAVQPINVRIEERVGKQVLDYVFNDRVRRRQEQKTKKHEKDRGDQESIISTGSNDTGMSRGTKDLELSRTQSSASIASSLHPSMMNGSNGDQSRPQKFAVVHSKDALEMKNRASKTKTFENIRVAPTVFMLSYQRDDSEKHSAFPLPECVDVQLRLPELNYVSKTWGFEDIVEAAKRDLKSHAWAQSASLLNQAFRKTSMFRSKKALRKLASLPSQINVDLSRLTSPPGSKLRHAIDPSAADDDNTPTPTGIAATPATGDLLHRALSRKSSRGDPMLSPQGRRGSIPGSPRASKSPEWRAKSTDNESDRDPEETLVENHSSSTAATRSPVLSRSPASQHYDQDEDEGGGKTGLRGLLGLGRFGRKKAESTDDLSSGSMVNRQHRRPSNADLAGSPPTTAAF